MTISSSASRWTHGPHWIFACMFVAAVVAIGAVIGVMNTPDAWYQALQKPFFNPPSWIFAPVWTLLYVLIGVAGWRSIFIARDGTLTWLWCVQMVLNYLWSPVFFGLKNPGLALLTILLLFGTIIAYTFLAARRDRISCILFVPYLLWVGFASILNGSIVALN